MMCILSSAWLEMCLFTFALMTTGVGFLNITCLLVVVLLLLHAVVVVVVVAAGSVQ